jgi:hypothetical protein
MIATPPVSPVDLFSYLQRKKPGDPVDSGIVRRRDEQTLMVTPGARPTG